MAALVVVSLAWALAVWQSGAVSDFDRSVTLVLIGAAAILASLGRSARNISPPPERVAIAASALLIVWIALSLAPLPLHLLEKLSPGRAAVVRAAAVLDASIGAAPVAFSPHSAVAWLEGAIGALVTVLLMRQLTWHRHGSWIPVLPLGAVALLEAALGLTQLLSGAEHPAGTFVNRNHYGGLLAVSLPFLAMPAVLFVKRQFTREIDTSAGFKAPLLVVACGLLLVAILLSQSRGASVATVCSLAAMAAILATHGLTGVRLWALRVLVIAATMAAFAFLAPPSLIQRFAEDRPADATAGDRVQFYKETTALIRDYPLFGVGLGGFEAGLQPYRRSALIWRVDFAHNDYLQIAAELGLPGALLLAVIVAIVLARVRRLCAHPRSEEQHHIAVACAGSWTAILVVAATDFNLYIPANAMLFAWVAGVSLGLAGERRLRAKA